MAKIKKCRVCNNDFEPCNGTGVLNLETYRSYCCSVECGQEYIRAVLESRSATGVVENVIDDNVDKVDIPRRKR